MAFEVSESGRRSVRGPARGQGGKAGYRELYDATADALADRVIERQWSYYASAGAAIAFAAGLFVGVMQWMADGLDRSMAMPVWFVVMGGILWLNAWAFKNEVPWRLWPQVALVAAMVAWPILMYIVFNVLP